MKNDSKDTTIGDFKNMVGAMVSAQDKAPQQVGAAEAVGYVDPMSILNLQAGRSSKEWLWAKPEAGNVPLYTYHAVSAVSASADPDGDFAKGMLMQLARMGATPAGLALGAQLFGVGPCEKCGYRKLHCRCPVDVTTASASGEVQRERASQATAVMPLIGPLLDSFDGIPGDVRSTLADEAPGLIKHIKGIYAAMLNERAPATKQASPEAVAEFIADAEAVGGAKFRLLKPLRVGSKLYAESAIDRSFLEDLKRSRTKYPNNGSMLDGLLGELHELKRAYKGDGDVCAEAFDVAVCAYRLAVEGDSGGNKKLDLIPDSFAWGTTHAQSNRVISKDEALVMEAYDFGQFSADMLNLRGLSEPVRQALCRILDKKYGELYGFDYKKILKAYIEHVGDMEGIDFLGGGCPNLPGLTEAEFAELKRISEEK
jgi:hypothetical protein